MATPKKAALATAITVLFTQIVIERDPMTKIPKMAAAWEVPVYRSQYGDEKVEILSDAIEMQISELPDANEEYIRLRDVFGIEPDTKQSHVDLVYGRGRAGVKALEEAIQASVAGDIEAAQAVVDGEGGADDETLEKRRGAYRDPLDEAGMSYDHARAVNDMGHRDPIGLAKVIGESADAADAANRQVEADRARAIADASQAVAQAATVPLEKTEVSTETTNPAVQAELDAKAAADAKASDAKTTKK